MPAHVKSYILKSAISHIHITVHLRVEHFKSLSMSHFFQDANHFQNDLCLVSENNFWWSCNEVRAGKAVLLDIKILEQVFGRAK